MAIKDSTEILSNTGLAPTPNRVLVLSELQDASAPMSLSELEQRLTTLDKSSIFRVLTLLSGHDLVHAIEDGRGITKYELCHSHDNITDDDLHCHFYCMKCRQTFCFSDVRVPEVEVPEGFSIRGVNYMLKGICPECSRLLN